MDMHVLLTPGTVNQIFELNEMFYTWQAKHMLKSIRDLGLYKHGPRVKNLTTVSDDKYTNSFHFK